MYVFVQYGRVLHHGVPDPVWVANQVLDTPVHDLPVYFFEVAFVESHAILFPFVLFGGVLAFFF